MKPRIWTVRDFGRALDTAIDPDDVLTLLAHRPHASHCGGYDAAAWPCAPALIVIRRIFGEASA